MFVFGIISFPIYIDTFLPLKQKVTFYVEKSTLLFSVSDMSWGVDYSLLMYLGLSHSFYWLQILLMGLVAVL